MSEQGFQERTEKATPKRREKAREEGKVAKSMELNAAAMLSIGFLTLYMMGPYMADQTMGIMRFTMANAPFIAKSDPSFHTVFVDNMTKFFLLLGPLFGVMVAVAFGVNVAQVGFKISSKAMEPKFEKLNPINGLKRLFALKSLVHMVRDFLKLAVIGLVAFYAIKSDFDSFFLLPDMTVGQFATTLGKLTLILALKMSAIILIIAILDYAYQKYEFEKSIKMSKQDIKDEYKDSDGSPQVKSKVRQIQREMARRRMMDAVPMADVVVTNPTHIAVALKYNPNESDAPMVIAKGERLVAQRIKEIAKAHDIPVVEDKPLARALFKMCDIGSIVPSSLFKAVAEVLAYVYKLKGKVIG